MLTKNCEETPIEQASGGQISDTILRVIIAAGSNIQSGKKIDTTAIALFQMTIPQIAAELLARRTAMARRPQLTCHN